MKAFAALFVLALAGCTTYVRPGASDYEMRNDLAACQYEGMKATAGTRNGVQAGYEKGQIETRCMEMRGYTLTFR